MAPNLPANLANSQKITDEQLLEKIGQMLFIGFEGTEISEDSYITQAMQDINIGGIILFDYNVPSKNLPKNIVSQDQTKKLISDLQKFSPTPLFIAVDAEGGYVNRLKTKYGFMEIPSAEEMGKESFEKTQQVSIDLSSQFVDLGLNVNFAPVVDVNINPDNPVIGGIERSFSTNPEKITSHAKAFIEGHHENNIITAIKHFPGHGSSQDDSHKGMADVTDTYKEKELIPYQELIKDGIVDMVMTAHIINRNIDPNYPATLSPYFIKDILREQLGFDGVVISDDMQMGAITEYYGFAESIVLAINAGCDMLIISNNNQTYNEQAPYDARQIIFDAVKNKKITINKILETNERITSLKKEYGIIK
ncbi:MAG: beta-N-acetylhexosaminidase [Patescibacteria group bacterium]|nr:beta-N-acetylhexosaminidase [Patescibacteria group bacterium]